MARLIAVDGNSRDVMPANGRCFTVAEIHALLDYELLEVVAMPDGRKMVIDEEGKINDRPFNLVATHLVKNWLAPTDFIVGNALVMTEEEMEAME